MKALRRLLSIATIVLAPVLIVFMLTQAYGSISAAPPGITTINASLQWGIILLVFIPVSLSLILFGYYGLKGEYENV